MRDWSGFIKRYGETPIVVNAVAAHHGRVKPETVYAGLVILADHFGGASGSARGIDDELHPATRPAGNSLSLGVSRRCDSGGPQIQPSLRRAR
jgi:hypothetical protein